MSTSDSDCSIDWLASDDDNDSVFESDCDRVGAGRTLPLPQRLCHTADPQDPRTTQSSCMPSEARRNSGQEEGSTSRCADSDGSSEGTLSSCEESWGRSRDRQPLSGRQEEAATSWCSSAEQSGCLLSEKPKHARKRERSSGELEHREGAHAGELEKDEMFAHKCMELQCYIHPLSAILNGLQSGRYRQRLSSFQESVAMDRIQRIMGVLQNPSMGERYINIILQVEVMLKNWFPNVKPRDQHLGDKTEEAAPSKKLKLSPATTALNLPKATSASLNVLPSSNKAHRNNDLPVTGAFSATNLKWLHTSPICTPSVELALGRLRHRAGPREKDVMQDNVVSSSTDVQSDAIATRPPLGKINAPCLERLLKSTESIISHKGTRGTKETSWS
ncbi:circadian-associated transcriptional repressor [Amia ocellicauda]|uniref:circadian-associated transcriptional repressor n=1 Tax=Amia ocellicauda TaxID=2972642 RepID=UPI0034647E02